MELAEVKEQNRNEGGQDAPERIHRQEAALNPVSGTQLDVYLLNQIWELSIVIQEYCCYP